MTVNFRRGDSNHGLAVSQIPSLPVELLVEIVQASLPSTEPIVDATSNTLYTYMTTLYARRAVSNQWRDIVDGTPYLWPFLLSVLPPHVNNTVIARSLGHPLAVVHVGESEGSHFPHYPSAKEFVEAIVHTRPRWAVYRGDLVRSTLDAPAPCLHTIKIQYKRGISDDSLDILGGSTATLRVLEVEQVDIKWRAGMFTHLRSFHLFGIQGVTCAHLLDVLHNNPGLEDLEFTVVSTIDNRWPNSPVVTLDHLQIIYISDCDSHLVDSILRRIRAPSCSRFYVEVCPSDEEGSEFQVDMFLDETLHPFEAIIRRIHRNHDFSRLYMDEMSFSWFPGNRNSHPRWDVGLSVRAASTLADNSWVARVFKDETGLQVFSYSLSDSLWSIISSMNSVDTILIQPSNVQGIFGLLAQPPDNNWSKLRVPSLKCLELPESSWTNQDLFRMLQTRYSNIPYNETKPPDGLTISLRRKALWHKNGLETLNLNRLAEIRRFKWVNSVELLGLKEKYSMLAPTWDDGEGQVKW